VLPAEVTTSTMGGLCESAGADSTTLATSVGVAVTV
jgi:hypothetical protein